MLKELALLVSLLTVFADARPRHIKVCDCHRETMVRFPPNSQLEDDLIEMSNEVVENSDLLTNRDDILRGKAAPLRE